MVNYKDLGFSNSKKVFEDAYKNGYAIGAYNFNNMEQIQAIVLACFETQSPALLQVSAGARKYADPDLLMGMANGAVNMMKRLAKEKGLKEIPVILHLDHGANFDVCKDCIDKGFSSVMIEKAKSAPVIESSFSAHEALIMKYVSLFYSLSFHSSKEQYLYLSISTDPDCMYERFFTNIR